MIISTIKRRRLLNMGRQKFLQKPKRVSTIKYRNARRKRNRVAHHSRMKNR